MRLSPLLGLVLAGCAGSLSSPQPQAARLSHDLLTVTLSDGSVCRAAWPAEGGAGRLDPCGPGFSYAVTEVANPNPLRRMFTGLTDALDAEGTVPPMAEIVIADATGRTTVFVSPPAVAD